MLCSPRVLFTALLASLLALPPLDATAQASRPGKVQGPSPAKKPARPKKNRKPQGPQRPAPAAQRRPPPPPPAPLVAPTAKPLGFAIARSALANGLRVVLSHDPSLPSVAVVLAVAAGPRHETAGQAGYASWVASSLIDTPLPSGQGSHRQLVATQHGWSDVLVDPDLVLYRTVVPKDALELALSLEAERLSTEPSDAALEAAKAALGKTEVAAGGESLLIEKLQGLAFQGFAPYFHDASGLTADVGRASAAEARAFHHSNYGPSDAALVVTGAFDPDTARDWVEQYFGAATNRAKASALPAPSLPEQINQRSTRIDPAPQASFLYGWAVPSEGTRDLRALSLVVHMLSDSSIDGTTARAPRLHRVASGTRITARLQPRSGPSLLAVTAMLNPEHDPHTVRRRIDDAVDELARLGPTSDEMRRGWREAEREFLEELTTLPGRGEQLARLELLRGDAQLIDTHLRDVFALTKDDVRKAVARYLTPTRRNLVEVPSSQPRSQPPPARTSAPDRPAAPRRGTSSRKAPDSPKKPASKKTSGGKR